MDELRLFNYALSDTEILDIYESLAGGVGIKEILPQEARPVRIYPNPFTSSTTFQYALARDSEVSLRIYNLLGREMETLVNQNQEAGEHTVTFDASHLDSGIYMYRLKIGSEEQRGKIILSE